MSKVNLNDIGTSFQSKEALNENFRLIEEAFDNTLSRDGSLPNNMEADINMDGNSIINIDELKLLSGETLATKEYVDAQDQAFDDAAVARENTIDQESKNRDQQNIEYTNAKVNEAIEGLQLDLVAGEVRTARYTYTVVGEEEQTISVPFNDFSIAEVFVNGVLQNPAKGAYQIFGQQFIFAEPLQQGDVVYFLLGLALEISEYTSIERDEFIATEGQTVFELNQSNLIITDIMLFINGVKQSELAYTLYSNIVLLSEAVNEGDIVEVLAFSPIQAEVTNVGAVLLQDQVINKNTLIPTGKNGLSVDPTIAPGVTVTVSQGSTWAIVGE